MPKGYEISRTLVKDERRLPRGVRVIALDERGREMTTRQFASLLAEPSAFLIGGPDGLSDESRKAAAMVIRLSAMTLPHALAQVVLLEQLYRAASLLTNHPYHRE
jgi:23S rRNA (pseudouridine1915-N3)-methyltransferase